MNSIPTATSKPQPHALRFLFATELWERFGFYTVQGLLILYMTQVLGFDDSHGYAILGVFSALAYIATLIGGYVADRLYGFTKTTLMGGFLLILGYGLLSVSNAILLYPALATIIIGNGLFKPNISSILGLQYEDHDPRRDSGFTLFYIGINIGVFLAGFSGYLKDYLGWHASFFAACIGMSIGVLTFWYGKRHFVKEPSTKQPLISMPQFISILAASILGVSFLLKLSMIANAVLPILGLCLLVFLGYQTIRLEFKAKMKFILLCLLIFFSIIFWMLFLQLFFSANLFIDRLVGKEWMHIQLTSTIFYASESVFIILLGPIMAWLWQSLSRLSINPSPIAKFTLGLVFVGFCFLTLGISIYYPNSHEMIYPAWIFLAYFFITIGELLISPIGLSAVTQLAPPQLTGLMMGIWFVATGFGGLFAGKIANLAIVPDTVKTTAGKLAIYQNAFFDFAYMAFFVALVLLCVYFFTKKTLSTEE